MQAARAQVVDYRARVEVETVPVVSGESGLLALSESWWNKFKCLSI
jgi:CRISPR/Cas system-associated protein Cas7 (RAMP superfamily)